MDSDWTDSWRGYTFHFSAPHGLGYEGTPRIALVVTHIGPNSVGTGNFKLRREYVSDGALGEEFDQLVISSINLVNGHQRLGLGTAIVHSLLAKFPKALFVGEQQNAASESWHANVLNVRFPTRAMDLDGYEGVRVRPGSPLDPNEL